MNWLLVVDIGVPVTVMFTTRYKYSIQIQILCLWNMALKVLVLKSLEQGSNSTIFLHSCLCFAKCMFAQQFPNFAWQLFAMQKWKLCSILLRILRCKICVCVTNRHISIVSCYFPCMSCKYLYPSPSILIINFSLYFYYK